MSCVMLALLHNFGARCCPPQATIPDGTRGGLAATGHAWAIVYQAMVLKAYETIVRQVMRDDSTVVWLMQFFWSSSWLACMYKDMQVLPTTGSNT